MTTIVDPTHQLFAPALGLEPGRGRLVGRNILILGAGQRANDDPAAMGNGRAMSLLFAREGAAVACADLETASAEETARRVQAEGGKAIALTADARDPE